MIIQFVLSGGCGETLCVKFDAAWIWSLAEKRNQMHLIVSVDHSILAQTN